MNGMQREGLFDFGVRRKEDVQDWDGVEEHVQGSIYEREGTSPKGRGGRGRGHHVGDEGRDGRRKREEDRRLRLDLSVYI
jgi:hypothetical protein